MESYYVKMVREPLYLKAAPGIKLAVLALLLLTACLSGRTT
jgi:hypothetical protein